MKRLFAGFCLSIGCIAFGTSCSKDNNSNSSGTAQVSMHLTDGPAVYDHVYLDIQKVEVTVSGSSAVTLSAIRPGVYDILQFRNGMDTLLLRANLPAGQVGQIRLILGSNNSVVVNGTTYALNTPSGTTSGVKLNLHDALVAGGAYDIWIDFDAAKSIVQNGNGNYQLQPVVRAYSQTTNGQVKGNVLPLSAGAVVYASNGTDTLSAIPSPVDGFFAFSGMASGTYSLWINPLPASGLHVYSQSNIQVSYGTAVNLGTITLK